MEIVASSLFGAGPTFATWNEDILVSAASIWTIYFICLSKVNQYYGNKNKMLEYPFKDAAKYFTVQSKTV